MNIKYSGILFFLLLTAISCRNEKAKNSGSPHATKLQGEIFGTTYSIIYDEDIDYQPQIDSLFNVIDRSMSTYLPDSDISKINRNEPVVIESNFKKVFEESKVIYQETEGAFDPTIGSVVNAWDFGPEGKILSLDSLKIDSLMLGVGFDKIKLVDGKIEKPSSTFLDFNAIAKGYAVDAVGMFLESQNIDNYLVEIGGEIRAFGINQRKNSNWKVGIEEPHFDGERSILRTLTLQNESMATSGVYRKFKIDENGNRYSHIIDTNTGYPSKSNILGISVIAKKCMTADAYATAFKSMGIERVIEFLKTHPELKVFIIYENETGKFDTLSLNGFPK